MDNVKISFLIYIIGYLGFTIFSAVQAFRTKNRRTLSVIFASWIIAVQAIGFYIFLFHLAPTYQMEENDINELGKLLFVYLPIFSLTTIFVIEKLLKKRI